MFPDPDRQTKAAEIRNRATALSTANPQDRHLSNQDEQFPYVFSFTKGLLHLDNGLLDHPGDFELFAEGTRTSDPTVFQMVPLNVDLQVIHGASQSDFDGLECPADKQTYREWESPTAGHAYVLEGPDPFAVTMPPAPKAGSAEFAAEMAEIYQMALSRDWPVAAFMDDSLVGDLTKADGTVLSNATKGRLQKANGDVGDAAKRLSGMRWFRGVGNGLDTAAREHRARRRFGTEMTPSTVFRGLGEDPWHSPFLSQFMVMGDGGCTRDTEGRAGGVIRYGAQRIDQKVRIAKPGKDYMTTWRDWLDVQNALNARPLVGIGQYLAPAGKVQYRTMSRLRDMATYVHDDQLYQAYLNAALILLQEKYSFDPGIPYHGKTGNDTPRWNREPFALFGGPHLLTLLTEVSSRALKAVRAQKFTVHRRLRPEAAGALFHTIYSGYDPNREHASKPFETGGDSAEARVRAQLGRTFATYSFPNGGGTEPPLEDILTDIREHNASQNGEDPSDYDIAKWLLPMAFPEGSPMHPAYGAGHATVAGACVTLLKAFFNMRNPDHPDKPAYLVEPGGTALVPDCGTGAEDTSIDLLGVAVGKGLTLEGELNKLLWNISNARNIAGVHYYTDYIESALLGEAITIGILREQMLAYESAENVSMTVPLLVRRKLPASLLSGSSIGPDQQVDAVRINRHGHLEAAPATPRQ
ncbi:bromoperoxidase [Roseibium algicola]|nr:bromoperoxidase [Roseibium aggregatum]